MSDIESSTQDMSDKLDFLHVDHIVALRFQLLDEHEVPQVYTCAGQYITTSLTQPLFAAAAADVHCVPR